MSRLDFLLWHCEWHFSSANGNGVFLSSAISESVFTTAPLCSIISFVSLKRFFFKHPELAFQPFEVVKEPFRVAEGVYSADVACKSPLRLHQGCVDAMQAKSFVELLCHICHFMFRFFMRHSAFLHVLYTDHVLQAYSNVGKMTLSFVRVVMPRLFHTCLDSLP